MNDDDILPPEKRGLRAKQQGSGNLPARSAGPLPPSSGAVSSALTGFQANIQARAHHEIAGNIRAQTDVLNAETARRESALRLLRTTHKLEEAPEILAVDRAQRQADRVAAYEQIDEGREERAHRAELRRRQRQAELETADRDTLDAQRQKFNAEQGFENQQRLKDLNYKIWETRTDIERLDALEHAERLRAASAAPQRPSGQAAVIAALEEAFAKVIESRLELEADGRDTTQLRAREAELVAMIASMS